MSSLVAKAACRQGGCAWRPAGVPVIAALGTAAKSLGGTRSSALGWRGSTGRQLLDRQALSSWAASGQRPAVVPGSGHPATATPCRRMSSDTSPPSDELGFEVAKSTIIPYSRKVRCEC